MSIINEDVVNKSIIEDNGNADNNNENNNRNFKGKSNFSSFLEERMFILTSYIDMLSYEYEKRKVYVEARSKKQTNIFCCLAVFTFLPEALVELSTMLACLIPGCFIDCCQEAVDNSTSLNMIMIENKLLHVNDEIIISKDFNADELFDIQIL